MKGVESNSLAVVIADMARTVHQRKHFQHWMAPSKGRVTDKSKAMEKRVNYTK